MILILMPASILTVLSMQAFRDEQRSALADLNVLVQLLQDEFGRRIEGFVVSLSERGEGGKGQFVAKVEGVE